MGNKIGRRQAVDEEHTRPQGLYKLNQLKEIDLKKLRKLILDYKLAPCYPGADECALNLDECPICFLYYPSLNRSRCCRKMICTECLLQLKASRSNKPTKCPFCKTTNYLVEYRGARTKEEKRKEQVEEQRVVEAQIRMRMQELQDEEDQGTRKNACNSGGKNFSRQPSSHDFCTSPSMSPTEESRSRVLQGEAREGGGIRYATSNLAVDDSSSAPFSLSENVGAASHLLPDNLEEQMMLAMAVSLAEFRAWARGSPGLAWLQ